MKYLAAFLFLFSSLSFSQTVINFDDGSTYTLKDGEQVFISNAHNVLFKRQLMKNKDTFFIAQKPWEKRDHVPQPTDGMAKGSKEWCETYVPFQNGYTFDDQLWERACKG